MENKAGIIFKQNFFTPDTTKMKKQTYSGLLDYMNKENNITSLENDHITNSERESLYKIFEKEFNSAQNEGRNIWHGIISFKTDFLEKHGLLTNEGKIKDDFLRSKITLAYKNLLAKEKIDFPNFVIGLHTDTKNYHYHIAFTTKFNTRINGDEEKGKFKAKNIMAFKAEIVNEITNAREINLEINKIKSKIKETVKSHEKYMNLINDDINMLYKSLPECNLSLWKYNASKMAPYRNEIDCISQKIINKYFKNEFAEYINHSEKLQKLYKESYGGKKNNFTEHKIQELYAYLGNAILKECRKLKKTEKYLSLHSKGKSVEFTKKNFLFVKKYMTMYFSDYKSKEMFTYELEKRRELENE